MKIVRIVTNRFTLSIFNLLILAVSVSSLVETFKLITDGRPNIVDIELILDGLAVIYIAFGVAIEERDTLMKFFGLYPEHFNKTEEIADRNCHFFGLMLLISGLFMELSVEIVKVPNRVINTEGIESLVFGIGVVFGFCAIYLLVRLTYLLIANRQGEYNY